MENTRLGQGQEIQQHLRNLLWRSPMGGSKRGDGQHGRKRPFDVRWRRCVGEGEGTSSCQHLPEGPTCTTSQVAGARPEGTPRERGVGEVLPPHLHLVSPPSSQAQDHPAPRQAMRDGCWGRSDVCNADKMSAILNGSGDAAVGVGWEGERAEQGGERKGE